MSKIIAKFKRYSVDFIFQTLKETNKFYIYLSKQDIELWDVEIKQYGSLKVEVSYFDKEKLDEIIQKYEEMEEERERINV